MQKMWSVLVASILGYVFLTFWITYYFETGQMYPDIYSSIREAISESFFEFPNQTTDAFIINTYYYPQSKSLGENGLAMVLLMNRNTMKDITEYNMTLVASNGTSQVSMTPTLIPEVFAPCSYINIVAKGNVLANMKKLEIVADDVRMEIPFGRARSSSPSPVIICLSPQFVAEQWQLFVAHAHVARRFGGHLHLYVTSMIDSYFELVLEYEKHGYVTIDFWMRVHFANVSSASPLEPNANSEWRNQAGAHTDCLLQYKEAATFITFFDLDDLLFPRGFDSYYEEFAFLSFMNPNILTFHYNKWEYEIKKEAKMADMNFLNIFGHSNYSPHFALGKIMARPSNLNSMWIHHSFHVPNKKRLYLRNKFITHLQRPNDTDGTAPAPFMKSQFVKSDEKAQNTTVLASIQNDFERMLNSSEVQRIASKLPVFSFYFPIVFQCYFDAYYGLTPKEKETKCPNIEGCELPQVSTKECVHSDAQYVSGPQMFPVTFHYYFNPIWSQNYGCYL